MGRWGLRIFQSDDALDFQYAIRHLIVDFLKCETMGPLLLNTPELREVGDKIIEDSDDERHEDGRGGFYLLEEEIERGDPLVRQILDNAVCYTLFDMVKGEWFPEIVVGAMMMQAGARLRPKDKRCLRRAIPYFPGGLSDLPQNGYQNAGQAQLSAVLDHYRAGTPRDFHAPSCDNCGKIEADIGTKLMECGRCLLSWWCNEECKTANAEKHFEHGACVDSSGQ